jgi:hypothetical protein
MLEIKPNLTKPAIAGACRQCGRAYSEAYYLYTAADGGEVLAAGLFEMRSDRVVAVHYESTDPGDHFLFDGILRAGLNYAAGQGVELGLIPESFRQENRHCFEKLRYPPEREWNIVNFFQKYKNCAT